MFCDCFSFGSCEELAIVRVRRWGFHKGLRVCKELLFGTAGFRKLISLLFAMIFGSQYAPFCCSELLVTNSKDLLLSIIGYQHVISSLNPLITLTHVIGYFNKLIILRSHYPIIIKLNFKIILLHRLLVGNN
jgi:hypothetical protein